MQTGKWTLFEEGRHYVSLLADDAIWMKEADDFEDKGLSLVCCTPFCGRWQLILKKKDFDDGWFRAKLQ